jgi:hypothetical protein
LFVSKSDSESTEGQSVNLTEIIQQTVICPSFIESIGPINANAVRSSIDDAMKNYVSTLETKVKSQDEKINKLKKTNNCLQNIHINQILSNNKY